MSVQQNSVVGAVEAGGTKFVCAIGNRAGATLLERAQFATGDDPTALLRAVATWFVTQHKKHGPLAALGVASFGPVNLDKTSPTYGFITTTPKHGWQHANLLGPLRQAFPGVPIGFDTDVNGAALGEARWGAARGLEDFIYITVGTGIGGGGMARGRLLHGLVHPEMGHISVPQRPGDTFAGKCPFHGPCWEGLCSGPAIAARTGIPSELLPPDHPAWDDVIFTMAHALKNLACVLSPRRIILGGSVRKAGLLGEAVFFDRLRAALREALAGYISSHALSEQGIANYIVPPELGDDAGVCGALGLAQDAAQETGLF